MAKALSPQAEKLRNSLTAISKAMSKLSPKSIRALSADRGGASSNTNPVRNLVRVHQVWCPEHGHAIGNPTTDVGRARTIRDDHNTDHDHHAHIVSSQTN